MKNIFMMMILLVGPTSMAQGHVYGGDSYEVKVIEIVSNLRLYLNSKDDATLLKISALGKESISKILSGVKVQIVHSQPSSAAVLATLKCEEKDTKLKICTQSTLTVNLALADRYRSDQGQASAIVALLLQGLQADDNNINLESVTLDTLDLMSEMQKADANNQ